MRSSTSAADSSDEPLSPEPPSALGEGLLVECADRILAEETKSVPSSSITSATDAPLWSAWMQAGDPAQHQFERLRERVQDLADELTRFVEQAAVAAASPGAPSEAGGGAAAPEPVGPELSQPLEAGVPLLRPMAARIGELVASRLAVVNESQGPARVLMRSTSLVSDRGEEIPARMVAFVPPELELGPGQREPVQVAVHVPAGARPGQYSGIVQAAGLQGTRALLTLLVDPEADRNAD